MTFKYLGQTGFGGYDKRIGAEDGAISFMQNMSAKDAPVLVSRPGRLRYKSISDKTPQGVYGSDKLYYIENGNFYAGMENKGSIGDAETIQQIIPIGNKLVIFPAWYSYDTRTDELESMTKPFEDQGPDEKWIMHYGYSLPADHVYTGYMRVIGEEFKKILVKGAKLSFIKYTNEAYQTVVDEDTVIDAVVYDGSYLIKFEKTNTSGPGIGSPYDTNEFEFIKIRILMPDFDFVFHSDNRLWGYTGHDIMCTSLGIPTAWNDFSGLTTDSWAATVNGSDEITGCGNVNGTPTFFCENCIYKIYGNNPTEYGYTRTEALGLKKGEQRSIATGGQYIYYVSRHGVCAYNGGIPTVISALLASEHFINAVGGSDGVRYYLTCQEEDGVNSLLVFDPSLGYWMREDSTQAVSYTNYHGNILIQTTDGEILGLGDNWSDEEAELFEREVTFSVVTSHYIDQWYAKKGANRMLLAYEAAAGTKGRVYVQYDEEKASVVAELYPGKRHTEEIPLPPNRYDTMKVTITGRGAIKIWMMARNTYASSERG